MVSLNLCKEYLNIATFKILNTILNPNKELNILIYNRMPSCLIICRNCKLLKWATLWLTLYILGLCMRGY